VAKEQVSFFSEKAFESFLDESQNMEMEQQLVRERLVVKAGTFLGQQTVSSIRLERGTFVIIDGTHRQIQTGVKAM
jgi:hypothetical protein